jgi:hypothetical protein
MGSVKTFRQINFWKTFPGTLGEFIVGDKYTENTRVYSGIRDYWEHKFGSSSSMIHGDKSEGTGSQKTTPKGCWCANAILKCIFF